MTVWFNFMLLSLTLNAKAFKQAQHSKCGYISCHPTKDGYINVHIVPHTHDDVGWTQTVDEYYEGKNNPHGLGVKDMLTSSFKALRKDKRRRFIYVESAYLFKWWNEQNPSVKKKFKKLIDHGQLALVSGGWSVNDEATTNYQSIIDQFTLGCSKINAKFGPCGRPKVGWQIHPFGHSSEMASIFAQLGFDGVFLGRIDYQDKKNRFKEHSAEMIWQGSRSLGEGSRIFTSVLYNTYWPPRGLCFDYLCNEIFAPHNREEKWKSLVEEMEKQAEVYRTNNIILTMGNDFHYTVAEMWFKNLDDLIEYGNDQQKHGSKFYLIYSTPSCYLKAVHEQAIKDAIKWPVKNDDFSLTLANPTVTGQVSILPGQHSNGLKEWETIFCNLKDIHLENINYLKEAVGVMQHHDAITGTEQQHVADDYARLLSIGFDKCQNVTFQSLNKLIKPKSHKTDTIPDFHFTSCLLTNISQCGFTENSESFVVTIYNPLSRPIDYYVRISVTGEDYSVKDSNGEIFPLQMVPIPQQVLDIPGRDSNTTIELVFCALQVTPLGFNSYYIKKKSKNETFKEKIQDSVSYKVSARINKTSGLLHQIKIKGRVIPIRQKFLYYQGALYLPRPSGAYIFHPQKNKAKPVSRNVTFEYHKGDVVTEIHQTFNSWTSQVIRIYPNEDFVELQWLVGPLPQTRISKEVVSRFTTNLKSGSTFYTDSNGREMQKRVRNTRSTWKLNVSQSVAGNYYPVTSKILIRDPSEDLEVAVLTNRSQGGTSLKDGEIELMVHRNSFVDDGLGVDEAFNEHAYGKPLVVRGTHYLVAGSYLDSYKKNLAFIEKDLVQRKLLESWTFLSSTQSLSYKSYRSLFKMKYAGLNSALPRNVQILSLEPWDTNRFLLRLEHVFEKDRDPVLSKSVYVNLQNLFKAFTVVDLRETTLGGNQWLDESDSMKFEPKQENKASRFRRQNRRKRFVSDDIEDTSDLQADSTRKRKFKIRLDPMQIPTFIVKIEKNV